MGTLGFTGLATIKSAGVVVSTRARIFDVSVGDTGAAAHSVQLYGGIGSSDTITPYMTLNSSTHFAISDVGYLFPTGCYCIASGCTASINYITEI